MKKLLFLLLIVSTTFAQKKLNFELDYSRFLFDDTTGFLEMYYGFRANELKPLNINNKFKVNGVVQVSIKEKATGKEILSKSWQIFDEYNSLSELNDKNLNGTISIRLYNNDYSVGVKAYDGNYPGSQDSTNFPLSIQSVPTDRFSISDIQLASTIKTADSKSDSYFVKNNHEVIPNPYGIFGENLPVLYFYSELYNLDSNTNSDFLQVDYIIKNSFDVNVVNRTKYVTTRNKSIVDVGALNILKYPTGIYTLVVEVKDSATSTFISQAKRFYIFNPSVKDTSTYISKKSGGALSEFSVMEEDELNLYFDYGKYIATQEDINAWKKIHTQDGKKEYLKNFWTDKNKSSGLEEKTYQMEYFRRIELANQRYTTMQKSGWKSDKGRVFVIYGEPSEIQRFPNEPDMKPYEVWSYNLIESGVLFIFANLEGFGEYSLIHSTKRGELTDENWQRFIQTK